jgi:hypothetical protein
MYMFCGAPNVQGLQRGQMGFWMYARLGVYLLSLARVAVAVVVVACVVMLMAGLPRDRRVRRRALPRRRRQKQPRLGPWRLLVQELLGRLPRKCLWQTM